MSIPPTLTTTRRSSALRSLAVFLSITYVKRDVPGPGKYSVPDMMEAAYLGKGPGGAMTAASVRVTMVTAITII